jgi:protein-S-isoprenylcysteine O-methyltransferase Ste14
MRHTKCVRHAMLTDVHLWIDDIWLTLGVIWVIGAVLTKRAARVQTTGSRLIQVALATGGFFLLLQPSMGIGPLGWRFLPASSAASVTGLALTICGAVLAVSARIFLGRNWSAVVTIKQDHEIIRRGPYALVRHPMYSGFLLAMLGTALAIGEVRGLLAVGLAFLGWWLKLRTEEQLLMDQFGAQYIEYRQHTKALIPFVL